MIGPVVGVELLRAGRRGRAHVLVWLFAGWLGFQFLYYLYAELLALAYSGRLDAIARATAIAAFARSFVNLVLAQQFVLLALVTPAFVAGAITDEKTSGTLQHLLTSRLTPAAIVLGKLCARTVQVGVLGLVPLPLVAVVGPYAGVSAEFLLIWLAVVALLIAGVSAVSVLASVWTKQTRSAVFLAYALLAGLVGLYGLAGNASFLPAGWLEAFDPLRPLALALDGTDPAGAFRRLGAFAVAWGGLGLAAAALAVWRLRPAYQRQIDARPRRLQLTIQAARPAPGDDALAWKECYVGQRLPTWLGLPLIAVVTAGVTYDALTSALVPRVENLMTIGCGALIVLTVYVSVRASGTISGERERQTWDGLLLTPLTVRQIVRGKLTEILKSAWQYLFTFWFSVAITALVLAPFSTSKAGVEFVAGLVVWLAVVAPAVYFAAAAGLYRSACSQSSWRSLLATLAINYVGGFVLFFFSTLLAWVGILLIGGLLTLFSNPGWTILGAMFWLAVVGYVYWLAARVFIDGAERQVALSERIRPESLIGFDTPYRLARPVQHQRL